MYHAFEWTKESLNRNHLMRHYEPLQPFFLMQLADRLSCDTFVDIGANIGAYSLFMTTVPSIRTIHTFEPSPETFQQLTQNVELNKLNINLYNKAASDRRHALQFGIVNTFSGANSAVDTTIHSQFERQIQVEAVAVDDTLAERGQRVCIKVDVEGHEKKVLAGMADYLARNEVVLQIEDYSDDPNEMARELKTYGARPLFRVGHDRYFTNTRIDLNDRQIVELMEQASNRLIQSSIAELDNIPSRLGDFVSLSLGRHLSLQLNGKAAALARGAWRKVRQRTLRA